MAQVAAAVAARSTKRGPQRIKRHVFERGRLVAHRYGTLSVSQLQVVVGHVVDVAVQHQIEELRNLEYAVGFGRRRAASGRGPGRYLIHHPLIHIEIARVHRQVAAQRLARRKEVAQVVADGARRREIGAAGRAIHALQHNLVVVEGSRAAADFYALRQVFAFVGHVGGPHRAAGHHILVAAGFHVGHVALGGNVAGHAAGHGHAFQGENPGDFGQVHRAAHVGIKYRLVDVVGREAAFQRFALQHHPKLRQVNLGIVHLPRSVHHRAVEVDVFNWGREFCRFHEAVAQADGRVHHRHLGFGVDALGRAIHEQLSAHGQVLHRVHFQRFGQVHVGFHPTVHLHRRQPVDGHAAIHGVRPQVEMKLRNIDLQIIGHARGVAHLHFQVDVSGGLRQIGVLKLAVGHHQVHAVAGQVLGVLRAFRVAIKRHLTAGFNVPELVGVRARHQTQEGFEIRFQRLERNVVRNVIGIGQPDNPGEAKRKVVELNLVIPERVQVSSQIHVHRHVGVELFVGHVGHAVVGHVEVSCRGLRLHIKHVAGEVATAAVVHPTGLHLEGEGQVLVAQAPVGQLPTLDGQAYLAGILAPGRSGRIRNHHVPVGSATFQPAQAQVGPLQLHAVYPDFLTSNHGHDIEPHPQVGQVCQRITAERVEPNYPQVPDVQGQIRKRAQQAYIDIGRVVLHRSPHTLGNLPVGHGPQLILKQHRGQGERHYQHPQKHNHTQQYFPHDRIDKLFQAKVKGPGRRPFTATWPWGAAAVATTIRFA